MDREKREAIFAAALFVVLTFYFTYPLSFNITDHLVNLRDPMLNTYIIGHGVKALATEPFGYFDAGIFYPHETTIAFSEHLFTQAVISAPFVLLTGNPVLGHNITLLLAFFLSGFGTYLLVRELTGNAPASLIAGTIFAFTNIRFLFIANLQIQWIAPLPFVVLYLLRFIKKGRAIHLFSFGLWLTVQVLSSVYYAAFSFLFVGLFIVLLALMRIKGLNLKNVAKIFACLVAVFIITLPFHIPYIIVNLRHGAEMTLRRAAQNPTGFGTYLTVPRTNKSFLAPLLNDLFSERIKGFFPGVAALLLSLSAAFFLHRTKRKIPLYRILILLFRVASVFYAFVLLFGMIAGLLPKGVGAAASDLAGIAQPFVVIPFLVVVGVYLSGLRYRNKDGQNAEGGAWRHFVVFGACAIVFLIISFGPFVDIGKVSMGNGLYLILFHLFPPLKAIRYVSRFAVLVVFCIAVMAGLGAVALMRRFKAKWAAGAIAAVSIVFMAYEYTTVPVMMEPVPKEMPEVYTWLAEQEGDFAIMELRVAKDPPNEGVRMYWSLKHGKKLVWGYSGFSPIRQQALAAVSGHVPAQKAVNYLLRVNFKYMLIHGAVTAPRYKKITEILKKRGNYLEFINLIGETAVFENLNYIRGKTEIRYILTKDLKNASISFEAKAAYWDGTLNQVMSVYIDDEKIEEIRLKKSWQDYSIPAPKLEGPADIRNLKFVYGYKLKEKFKETRDDKEDTVPADVDLRSVFRRSGTISQLFSHAIINGQSYDRLGSGYNLFVVKPATGIVEQRGHFDTFRDPKASKRLVEFIGGIPKGHYVVTTTCFGAGTHLSQGAVAALRELGSKQAGEIRKGTATNHVFIGRKGAEPGSILEKTGKKEITLKVGRDQEPYGFKIRDLSIK